MIKMSQVCLLLLLMLLVLLLERLGYRLMMRSIEKSNMLGL